MHVSGFIYKSIVNSNVLAYVSAAAPEIEMDNSLTLVGTVQVRVVRGSTVRRRTDTLPGTLSAETVCKYPAAGYETRKLLARSLKYW